MAADGVKAQTCVTSPPYFGLRDYGHPGQLGLEATPDEYIAAMVEVFRCVRDVLADDGTLWLNIGDSYAKAGGRGKWQGRQANAEGAATGGAGEERQHETPAGLKAKTSSASPGCSPFALRADGWYLRQDIIWHKPNPMPESVTDRCTKAHEYIFCCRSRRVYYDAEAIAQPFAEFSNDRLRNPILRTRRKRPNPAKLTGT